MEWDQLISQFGVAGVIVGGLVIDRLRLLKENEVLQKEVRQLYESNAATLNELTASLNRLASAARVTRDGE